MKIINAVEVEEKWYDISMLSANPKKLYVFGDNTIRAGRGGQASIRDCFNAIGVATKRLPSLGESSYYNDSESDYKAITNDLFNLSKVISSPEYQDWTIVFPKDGLGTGLAEMPQRSPFLFDVMSKYLKQYFGIITNDDGTLSI